MIGETIRATIAEAKIAQQEAHYGRELLHRLKDAQAQADDSYLGLVMQIFETEVKEQGLELGAVVRDAVYRVHRPDSIEISEAAAELGWRYRTQRMQQLAGAPSDRANRPSNVPSESEILWSETVDKALELGIKPEVVQTVVETLINPT